MIPTSIQYFVISYIIIRIYIVVNSVINHANYLQLQKHIKYYTSHPYYIHLSIILYTKTK